ncbi:MAG TPA: adenylate/guanylate cyclase domain-containing protein [Leptospiraceae bacterium]|nr:adenylate/guanylate cyclase domain-containing protein [Leptospirales bacterium]HMU82117.1 adenylate/guanylate cyclase domain-containing protein [Leptospiraceae bacterium]HMX55878.1 adenylate/guanylate cyclase domain-containing protein [Leptospiraceae bacterium]HMZ35175.1 adenylate/guanylate cyclase domain-containing protein [Leptospiraceae bacterium]HNE21667.1 adenylate/guanylate cyclase domain-containing protein [Leptospiraceae bacterium]
MFRSSVLQAIGHSLTTDQMDILAHEVNESFNLGVVSGFGSSIRVPLQVAVRCIGDFFAQDKDLLAFLAHVLAREGKFVAGSQVLLKGKAALLELLEAESWHYDREMRQFVRDQAMERTADWGHMAEGREYHLTFASVDVVGSSQFGHENAQVFAQMREYVRNYAEVWNGRLWNWMGDGGMAAFHGADSVNRCVISMLAVLMNLPVFNIKYLAQGPELRIRVGIHYGTATYKQPVNEIFSSDMRVAQKLESEVSEPNRMAISGSVYTFLKPEMYPCFVAGPRFDHLETYRLTEIPL